MTSQMSPPNSRQAYAIYNTPAKYVRNVDRRY
jgi:hypothetical protein